MRKTKEKREQTPEEIGRRLAEEFQHRWQEDQIRQRAEELERQSHNRTVIQLRTALFSAVYGYNQHIPSDYQIAVLDRADHLVFQAADRGKLTLRWGIHRLMLESTTADSRTLPTIVYDLLRDQEGIRFRAVPNSELHAGPTLSQGEFVRSVLRMACGACEA